MDEGWRWATLADAVGAVHDLAIHGQVFYEVGVDGLAHRIEQQPRFPIRDNMDSPTSTEQGSSS